MKKRIEEKEYFEILKEAVKRLGDILENSPILFYSHTPDDIIKFATPHSNQIFDSDPDKDGIRWTELLTDNPVNQKGIGLTKKAFETGMPQKPYEIEMKNNKNETVWFEVHEIPIVKDGNTILLLGSLTDITTRKKTEEKLQASQSLLTDALEMASMGHWEYDVVSDTFTFNDQFYKMLRSSINEIGSYTMSSKDYANRFFHSDDHGLFGQVIKNSVNTANPDYHRELEHRIIFADGAFGTLAVRFNIVKDRNGNTIKTYGVNQDITKHKSIENELIQAKEKAEESNRLKSIFLANMSHELRTPMVGVLGFTDILLKELNDPSHIEMVSVIKNSGERLISTLDLILDLSRIEANKQHINISKINLNEIIGEIIKLYLPIVKNKNIYIEYISQDDKLYLNSDRELLFHILNNLVDNAVKYTHHGRIVVKSVVEDSVFGKNISIEITDTGIGIPAEYHDLIFVPFRQVSEGFSRKFEGTGLGLSITKKYVELLKGSINFKSEAGRGSTFTVTFPYTNIDEEKIFDSSSSANENKITNEALNNITILLVEDNPDNASLILLYLRDYMRTDHISDGQTAIEICNSKKYDAILMDINLKGIDGVETLKRIRNIDYHYSKIPIIAVTAYAMIGDREKFISSGFTDYISKPFDRSHLLTVLTAIFKKN